MKMAVTHAKRGRTAKSAPRAPAEEVNPVLDAISGMASKLPPLKAINLDLVIQSRGRPLAGARLAQHGIPAQLVTAAAERFDLPKDFFLELLAVSKATLHRMEQANRALKVTESDALKDASQVLDKALTMAQGDRRILHAWLYQRMPALDGAPIEFLKTADGRRLLASLLDRVQSGAYA